MNNLPKQFIEFMQTSITNEKEYNKGSVFANFTKTNKEFSEWSQNRFSRMLETYVEILGFDINQRRSGDKAYFTIIPKIPK